MSKPRFTSARIVSLFCVVVGCGSSSSGGAAPGPPANVTIDQLPAVLAQAECEALHACFGALAPIALGPAVADCVTHESKVLAAGRLASYPAFVNGGTLAYDGNSVNGCADAVRVRPCDVANAQPAACDGVFQGKVPVGGACTDDVECAGRGVCVGTGTCPGVCATRGAAGSACSRTAQCLDGLVCDGKACVAPAAAGQPCDVGAPPCGALICVGADPANMKAGTCKAPPDLATAPLGAACDPNTSVFCVAGAFCARTSVGAGPPTYQCVGASAKGGPCKVATPEVCPVGQHCSAGQMVGTIDGTCVDAAGTGAACSGVGPFNNCAVESACVAKVCKVVQDNGAACSSASECYSGHCASGTCQPTTSCSQP